MKKCQIYKAEKKVEFDIYKAENWGPKLRASGLKG